MNPDIFKKLKPYNMMEKQRLDTFKCWPFDENSPCSIKKMAEAGFYWCGNAFELDTVACFVCDKTLYGWEPTDDPWEEHAKHAPQCFFVKKRKPEGELTVDEFIIIFGIVLKNSVTKKAVEIINEFSNEAMLYLENKKTEKK